MRFLPRTDLAVEEVEKDSIIDDFQIKSIDIQKVVIDKDSSKKFNKKEGIYYTLDAKIILNLDHDKGNDMSYALAQILEEIYDEFNLNQDSYVLILGLGNEEITPDSLGPKVVKNIFVTKHLKDLGHLEEGLGIIGALAPGVMGQTGIETSDIIKAMVTKTRPQLVIAVDALASRSIHRVNSTIQISTVGINPGSGVGNKRKEISKESIGIPVIAIGVPTVVDIASIFYDLKYFFNEDARDEFRDNLTEADLNFMVTNKDIDEMMVFAADIISKALNTSIHNLDAYE